MKKKILIIITTALIFTLTLTACDPLKEGDNQNKKSAKTTNQYTEAAVNAVPYPLEEMKASGWLERQNLKERLLRYSKANKISYIYLLSMQGQLIASYTVKGKVSNTASQLTASQKVDTSGGQGASTTLDLPDDQATWGPTDPGIFFFTTDGVMIQWTGDYVLADAPLGITTAPQLVYTEGSKPTESK